jgi:hypothetical protein
MTLGFLLSSIEGLRLLVTHAACCHYSCVLSWAERVYGVPIDELRKHLHWRFHAMIYPLPRGGPGR